MKIKKPSSPKPRPKSIIYTLAPLLVSTPFVLTGFPAFSTNTPGGNFASAPAKIQSAVEGKINNYAINHTFDVVNVNLGNGLSSKLSYQYSSQPASDGQHMRMDSWHLNTNLNYGLPIDSKNTLGFGISKNSTIQFLRKRPSKQEALLLVPHTIAQLPFKANRFDKIEVGEIVRLRTQLIAQTGLPLFSASQGLVSAGASAYYQLSGEFYVDVIKASDHTARLRLSAIRRNNKGASASVNPADLNLQITRWSWLDNKVEHKVISNNILSADLHKNKADDYFISYDIDFNQPGVTDAYNSIFSSLANVVSKGPESARILNPLTSSKELGENLVVNLLPLEKLRLASKSDDGEMPAVVKNFSGTVENVTKGGHLKIGMNLLQLNYDRNISESKITYFDSQDKPHNYKIIRYSRNVTGSKYWGREVSRSNNNASMVWKSDSNFEIHNESDFQGLRFSSTNFYDKLRASSRDELFTHIKYNLPAPVLNAIESSTALSSWLTSQTKNNASINYRFTINSRGFHALLGTNSLPLATREYFSKVFGESPEYTLQHAAPIIQDPSITIPELLYEPDIKSISKVLTSTFNSGEDDMAPEKRLENFVNLVYTDLFREFGAGLLLSLIDNADPGNLGQNISYNLEAKAENADDYALPTFGRNDDLEESLFQTLSYVESVVQNDTLYIDLLSNKDKGLLQ